VQYLTIHETIQVAGVYAQAKFQPTAFVWSGKKWNISEVTAIVNQRDGGVELRHYSVVANQQVCRLLFNRDAEKWWLEEIWDEPLAAC
jgi:hypothetical protein